MTCNDRYVICNDLDVGVQHTKLLMLRFDPFRYVCTAVCRDSILLSLDARCLPAAWNTDETQRLWAAYQPFPPSQRDNTCCSISG